MRKLHWCLLVWTFGVGFCQSSGGAWAQAIVATPGAEPAKAGGAAASDSSQDDGLLGELPSLDSLSLFEPRALDEVNRAIAKSPNDAGAYDDRGCYFFGEKQYERAVADFKKAIALNPKAMWAHHHLALTYRARHDSANALAEYGKAIALEAPSTSLLGVRADYLASLGRNTEALADYNRRVALEPNKVSGYYWRAKFYASHVDWEKALPDYTRMVELEPSNFEYRVEQADALRSLSRFDEAIASYLKAIELKPDNMSAWNNLGVSYWRTKTYDKARDSFAKALTLKDEDNITGYVYLNRAWMAFEQSKRASALEDLNAALANEASRKTLKAKPCLDNTSLAQVYFYRSLIKGRSLTMGSPDAETAPVIADATQAVQLDPLLAQKYARSGRILLGNVDAKYGLVALLTGAVAARPTDAALLLKLGDAQVDTFHSDQAIVTDTKALALDPKSGDALKSRALAYANRATPYKAADWTPAVADWKSYLARTPDDVEALQQLGLAQYNAGQTTEGMASFRHLLAGKPENAYAHLMLGLGLAITGDRQGAKTEVKNYLTKASSDEMEKATSAFGNAKTNYPTNEAIEEIFSLMPEEENGGGGEIPFMV